MINTAVKVKECKQGLPPYIFFIKYLYIFNRIIIYKITRTGMVSHIAASSSLRLGLNSASRLLSESNRKVPLSSCDNKLEKLTRNMTKLTVDMSQKAHRLYHIIL